MSVAPLSRILLKPKKPYLMAHRGNRVACPENTLAAFKRALADGADIIETDLHLTRDEAFVCIHDATLDRTTDGQGLVASKTLAEIKQYSAAYGRLEFAAERVPTLAELAEVVSAPTVIALELKDDAFLRPEISERFAHELERLQLHKRTVVLSFSRERLKAINTSAPQIPTGWITMNNPFPRQGTPLIGPFWPILLFNPLYVWWAHRNHQIVCPLDPTPDSRLRFYLWLGCDTILSDDPRATKKALEKLKRTR